MACYIGLMLAAVLLLRWFVQGVLLRLVRRLPVELPGHLVERLNAPVTLLLMLAGLSLCGETVRFPAALWNLLSKILYAKFIHASLGLRYLLANMGRHGGEDLRAMTVLRESIASPAGGSRCPAGRAGCG